jgi:PAS domain S-box-containing protein
MREGLAIDDENEKITYANDAFAKMLGYSPSELIGRNWVDLTAAKDHKAARERLRNRKDGKSERYEMEWVNRRGEAVPTIIAAAPYFDSKGKFVGSFAVITEISEQKNAEETVQFYLDLITHDIANQLQVIMVSAGLLEQNLPPSIIDEARHDILDAVERCNRLITKTKRAGQIRGIPNASVDLSSAIKEKIEVLERVYDAQVHVEGFDSPVWVKADSLLGELLWNILENAAGHNTKEDKQVWVSGQREGQWFRLSIADNGPGISGARKKSLFDRTKRFGGVGLALVAQMVRKYGARIEVEDRVSGKPPLGASFIITFENSEPS